MTVGVCDCRVSVLMAMLSDHRFGVNMVMVAVVVPVPVLMGFLRVDMGVRMLFGDGEIRSGKHDPQCGQEGAGYRIAEHDPGKQDADKRRRGVINACSGRAQYSLGCDVKEDTQSVGNEAQKQRRQYVS